jgi:hypothetical protein
VGQTWFCAAVLSFPESFACGGQDLLERGRQASVFLRKIRAFSGINPQEKCSQNGAANTDRKSAQ